MKLRDRIRKRGPRMLLIETRHGRRRVLGIVDPNRASHAILREWWNRQQTRRDAARRCAHRFDGNALRCSAWCGLSMQEIALG